MQMNFLHHKKSHYLKHAPSTVMRPHRWETMFLLLNRASTPWSSLASKSKDSQALKMHEKANELGSAD
jgi:hypothetical protein